MSTVFISYRRDDSLVETRELMIALEPYFGRNCVFRDQESIPSGIDFRQSLSAALDGCRLMLVVIGDRWIGENVPDSSLRRIDDPNDYVRAEISTALKKKIPVVPVLVRDAQIPIATDLPDDIAELTFRNAIRLSDAQTSVDQNTELVKDIVNHLLSREQVLEKSTLDDCPDGCIVEQRGEEWRVGARSNGAMLAVDGSGCFLFFFSCIFIWGASCFLVVLVLFVAEAFVEEPPFGLSIVLGFLPAALLLLGSVYWLLNRLFSFTQIHVRGETATLTEGLPMVRRKIEFQWATARIEPRVQEIAVAIEVSQRPRVERVTAIGSTLPDDSRRFLFWYLWNRSQNKGTLGTTKPSNHAVNRSGESGGN